MSIGAGSRLGSYEVLALLGAGGMGEVYRARDTKLGREVAIKILSEGFAQDPDRVARFQREAQLLAALNHPHIAAIHGLEESQTTRFLVLELVDGESLADLLGRRSSQPSAVSSQPSRGLPVSAALGLARQIADALEAAHEKGIIHRDLKPANIMLTAEGQVKVLDFGLAKALGPSDAGHHDLRVDAGALTHSPTLSVGATQAGVILGTAAYMSPEQAKGRVADKRTDVWAFGCVLYEILTGKRAFEGEDVTDTIAAVVRGEPDWSALPPDVPEQIRLLIRRCLEKDRRARIGDVSTARFLMTETLSSTSAAVAAPQPVPVTVPGRRVWVTASVALLAGIILATVAAWAVMRLTATPSLKPVRFAIVPPPSQPLGLGDQDRIVAISPDDTHIAYRVVGGSQFSLMIRPLNELDGRPVPGVGVVRGPFFSPNGQWVGFFDEQLKKVSVTGGPSVPLCRIAGLPRGASWGPDDTIVFATSDVTTGLLTVPAGGGEPTLLTKPDPSQGEFDHLFPAVLPDGRTVLFTITSLGSTAENSQIAALDLNTGQRKILIRGGTRAEYVETGHLVYGAANSLRAVRFDPERIEVLGDPVPIVDQVMTPASGAANFAVSRHGSLVYVPGTAASQAPPRSIVWVDRQGREESIDVPARAYAVPRISPDGTRVALAIQDRGIDIWIWDFLRRTLTPLTFDPTNDQSPIWTPDSRRIIWASTNSAAPAMVWRAADGTGAGEQLIRQGGAGLAWFPTSISKDGTRVFLFENTGSSRYDVAMLALPDPSTSRAQDRRSTEPLVHTSASELNPDISPDDRWLAYQSNKSGLYEIYVSPFPNVDGGLWQISQGGGTRPAWSRDGRRLFYLDAKNLLTEVPVQAAGSAFSLGNPTTILRTPYYAGSTMGGLDLRGYDVSPDGRRFLMIKENAPSAATPAALPPSIVVVLNWAEELKARVPNVTR
jgi:serine/threonine-protein kinase